MSAEEASRLATSRTKTKDHEPSTAHQISASGPVLVPQGDATGLGSAIFAFLACGAFSTVEQAQERLCPGFQTFEPQSGSHSSYEELFWHFLQLYFAFGSKDSSPVKLGRVLPALRNLAAALNPPIFERSFSILGFKCLSLAQPAVPWVNE
jgi:hypothetical protein